MKKEAGAREFGSGKTILIVDDEASIRKTLSGVLTDEGFEILLAEDGLKALEVLKKKSPSLVLLDIWMPGLDGMETLQQIKKLHGQLPVIMISGHATIATAIKATRLGAADFIEKPLDLEMTMDAIRRALGAENATPDEEKRAAEVDGDQEHLELGERSGGTEINPVVFTNQMSRGRKIPQKTLAHSSLLYGQGLHSGKKSGLIFEPLPPNSGIHFASVSETSVVPAHVDYVGSTGFATTIRLGRTQAGTIEHIMSALHAYGISNLLIKCNGEVPVMDGSAREFCSLIEEIGVEEQEGDWYGIKVSKTLRVGDDREYIQCEPADDFIIDYTLEYPAPIGRQRMVFTLNDVETYKREIAPARTFGFVKDIGALQKQGLALGGRFDNFVLIGAEGAINGEMRFKDEPVRHKILDAIGDLYLLGRTIHGRITAKMTGHSDNIELLRLLREEMRAEFTA